MTPAEYHRAFIHGCRVRALGLLAACLAGWGVIVLAAYGLVRLVRG